MDNCIFCKIIKGEIPSFKVAEDEDHLAFLTITPLKEGHTLVIPKTHVDYLFSMEDEDLSKLMIFTKRVSDKLLKTFTPASAKIGVQVIGEEVHHTHIHLIPFDNVRDFDLSKAKETSLPELQAALDKINSQS